MSGTHHEPSRYGHKLIVRLRKDKSRDLSFEKLLQRFWQRNEEEVIEVLIKSLLFGATRNATKKNEEVRRTNAWADLTNGRPIFRVHRL